MKTQLAFLTAILLAATAQAGSYASPEAPDGHDDVSVNGLCNGGFTGTPPCPSMDFVWPNVDIENAWITDTADNLVATLQMKNGQAFADPTSPGFGAPSPQMTYAYAFHFTAAGVDHAATATFDEEGTLTAGGDATKAELLPALDSSTGPLLVLTVPKAALGLFAGDALTGIYATAFGTDIVDGDVTVDDRAPDANFGRDYVVANGTARATPIVYSTVATPTFSVRLGFDNATTGTFVYNWTAGPRNATFAAVMPGTGAWSVTVLDAAGATVAAGANTTAQVIKDIRGAAPGTWQVRLVLSEYAGNATVGIAPQVSGSGGGGTTTTSTSMPVCTTCGTSSSTTAASSSSKASPGMDALALACAGLAAVVVARRRLP